MSMNPLSNRNCQFSAISYTLQGLGMYRSGSEEILQQDVVHYLSKTNFIGTSNGWTRLQKLEKYNLHRMSLNFEYGDQPTLQGISELYNERIIIVSTMNHGRT
jgi:hypothetical protein